MTKTYGKLSYGTAPLDWSGKTRSAWGMLVEPHVAIRAKRTFPRAVQSRTAYIVLDDTPDVARDLEWFVSRYPLEMTEKTQARLTARADEDRAREQQVLDILGGDYQHTIAGWQEPTRSAREYQTQAADMAWTMKGMILGDDVGLGKTQSGLLLLRDPDTRPALVVTLTHLPPQWLRELEAVFPLMVGHIVKTTTPYPVDADVLIMNYHKLHGWRDYLAGRVRTVIFDEVQELRKGDSNKYRAAAQIADKAEWRLGLTATPVYNYGGEIHTLYDVIAPGELGSRSEFIREWGGSYIGASDNIAIKDPAALGTHLRDKGLMLRRTRKDVHRELPEPIKILQEVPANEDALDEVKGDVQALARLLLDADADAKEKWRAAGEIDWKLRQATGVAKAPYVAEFVRLILESEEAVVLYGWHRAVYDIWLDALAEYNPLMYTGSESVKKKDEMAQAFIRGESRVMLMSLRSGAGLDGLQERASVVVFGELDWSPAMHDQAIGRLARDGQEATVAAYFCVTGSGSDPAIADVLQIKTQQAEPIRNPDAELFNSNVGAVDVSRTRRLLDAVGAAGGVRA